MDELFHAISLAPSEEARRAILKKHARAFPRLLEPPEFPEDFSAYDPSLVRRDYLLFTAKFSAFDRAGFLLLRCVYTGEFGLEPGAEDLGFGMIGMVASLDLAVTERDGAPPFWTSVSFGLLPYEVVEALDARIIEREAAKIAN